MPNKNQRPDKSDRPQPPRKGEEMGRDMEMDRDQRQTQAAPGLDGTERARDEQRQGGGPRYAGGAWRVANERGDRRFGHARIDDADPSELAPGEAQNDDDESPSAADPELAAAEAAQEIESGGQRESIGRGEQPRKPKRRAK